MADPIPYVWSEVGIDDPVPTRPQVFLPNGNRVEGIPSLMPRTEKTPPTNLNPPRMPVTEKTPPTDLTPPTKNRNKPYKPDAPAPEPAWYETDNFYKALTNLGLGLLARNKPGYGGLQGFAQALGESGLDTTSYLEQLNAAERAAAGEARAADRADRALDIQEQANQLANARGLQQLQVEQQKLGLEIAKATSAEQKAALERQLKIVEMAIDMYTAQAEATYTTPESLEPFVTDIMTQVNPGARPATVLRSTDLGFESAK